MNDHTASEPPINLALPAGWHLIDRVDALGTVWLEFQKDGRMGPRVSGIGKTFDDALASALDRMLHIDERERQRRAG